MTNFCFVIDIVQLWSKEVCVDRSGPNRVQPKCSGPKQPRRQNLCEKNQRRESDVQQQPQATRRFLKRQHA